MPMAAWKTSPCRGCGDPMIWTVTAKGKKMPVNAEEVSRAEAGPKALLFEIHESETDDKTPSAVVTHAHEGHQAHWATCPDREDFKKP